MLEWEGRLGLEVSSLEAGKLAPQSGLRAGEHTAPARLASHPRTAGHRDVCTAVSFQSRRALYPGVFQRLKAQGDANKGREAAAGRPHCIHI